MRELLQKPEWSRKLEQAKTMRDVERLLMEYCRKNKKKFIRL